MPNYDDALEAYVRDLFAREDDVLTRIRSAIAERGLPQITVRPEEGRFLQFLATVSGAGLALEIGTLGGYSTTWIARGLVEGGRLISLEQEADRAEIARQHLRMAGLADRVEIHVGDAHEQLPHLAPEGPFDFIFIDAEKEGYPDYLAWSLQHLRPGGIVAGHNAFSHGAVVDESDRRPRTLALRAFNRQLAEDPRLISMVFPAGDGIAFGVKHKA